ncbi:MAG: HEPN domain-containing protein [Candidatus Micrarchaeota archaeon]|nr:HEPN domain-containing protein [Candidatus Micrarchaeota archaeon]
MEDKLKRCFEGEGNLPPRLIRKKPDMDTVEAHLHKAETNSAVMDVMFQNKFFDWTIVAAYYSMYHATLSALWLIGIDARSHECAVLAFERFYAKKGKVESKYLEYLQRAKELSEKYSETLEQVRTLRVKASYGLGEIHSTDAAFSRTQAREFISEIRNIVNEAKGLG